MTSHPWLKVRIKCRDYVKKIAVYKDRLAVQVPHDASFIIGFLTVVGC